MKIALPAARYDADQKKAAFYDELARRVQSLPGVRSAAVTLTLPMTGFAGTPVERADGPPMQLNQRPIGIFQNITPAYFRTLEIPLRYRPSAQAPPATAMFAVRTEGDPLQ